MVASLPPVSAKVVADVEKFVSDFRRAERAASGSLGNIDREVDKLTKQISRKFSAADIGKDVLKGLGLGSGFALAQQAGELITGYYQKAAEAAKDMADSSERQLDNTKALIGLHQTDEQKLASINKEYAEAQRRLADMQKPVFRTVTTRKKVFGDLVETDRLVPRDRTKEENDALNQQIELVGKLDFARTQLGQKVDQAQRDELVKTTALIGGLNRKKLEYDGIDEAQARGAAALREWNDEMDKAAQGFRELADPSLKFKTQMEQVNDLLERGELRSNEAAAAIKKLGRAMDDALSDDVTKALNDFFEPLDERQRQLDQIGEGIAKMGREVGDAFSGAFEDAIISGKKFSDVLDGLAQDIMRIAIRTAITQPIGAAIGGLFTAGLGAAFTGIFGKPAAEGGYRDGTKPYLVGEEGPELFNPGKGGTIIPTNKLAAGGNTYVIDARGADAGAVDRIAHALKALAGPGVVEQRALNAVTSARRRGYGY